MSELPLRTFQTITVFVKHFYGGSTLLAVPLFCDYWTARLSVARGTCSAVLPTVHGCHYAFQKFPFFCVTLCINNQQVNFDIKDIFYSWCSHQHVSAGNRAIFRVMFLLHEYNCGHLCHHHCMIIKIVYYQLQLFKEYKYRLRMHNY